ncbi:MAG: tol-pal system protein YbgF [Pseudohongiellaceae bacterium]
MNSKVSVTTKLASCLLAGTLSCAAFAQNNGGVFESLGVTPGQAPSQSGAPLNSDALNLLLEQNRQLREELQALRGMVEEQSFELRRLQRDSLNRYTNMDERLTALESAAVAPNRAGGGTSPAAGDATAPPATAAGNRPFASTPGARNDNTSPNAGNAAAAPGRSTPNDTVRNRPSTRGVLQPAVLSEQQLYQMAYDSVINSNFERSIAEFDQYLSVYPEGRFVTNAHYWKGQAYLYLNRYEDARRSYEIILSDHPNDAKLPDAMYGLALAFQGLDNSSRARQLLNEIKRRFPNTGVANLADTRLLTLD